MCGGAKNIFEKSFVLPKNAKKNINLPSVHIKKIGEFMINDRAIIGDCYWRKINLINGIYKAYMVNDNLMIIHKDLEEPENIESWTWTNSGTGVDVESGIFEFFDLVTIKKLSKKSNQMPRFDFFTNSMTNIESGILVDNRYLEKSNENINYSVFGVVASTGIGDGGFQCFVINNNKAILIGGLTGEQLDLWSTE